MHPKWQVISISSKTEHTEYNSKGVHYSACIIKGVETSILDNPLFEPYMLHDYTLPTTKISHNYGTLTTLSSSLPANETPFWSF